MLPAEVEIRTYFGPIRYKTECIPLDQHESVDPNETVRLESPNDLHLELSALGPRARRALGVLGLSTKYLAFTLDRQGPRCTVGVYQQGDPQPTAVRTFPLQPGPIFPRRRSWQLFTRHTKVTVQDPISRLL